jgi:hypothetical protein
VDKYELTTGKGRTEVILSAHHIGDELVVFIYNENAHIGAVAIGEYDYKEERTSTSVITRLGHKDDAVAQQAAYLISKAMKKPVCVVAGIHLDNITNKEIDKLLENASGVVNRLINEEL